MTQDPVSALRSLETHGFLSPDIERFRLAVRATEPFKKWFEFADDLVEVGSGILKEHEVSRHDNQQLLLSGFFIRAHQALQASVILAEKGMIPDARAIVRGAVETAIASAAVAADEAFIEQLIGADNKHKLTTASALLGDADYRSRHGSAEIAKLEATIQEIERIDKTAPRAPKVINWKSVADKFGSKDLYLSLYRLFSSDGTHTTIDVMNRYVETDAAGEITALKLGPDHTDLDDTLNAACLSFLWAAIPFAKHFEYKQFDRRISDELGRYRALAHI
jgi:Family of unknown function (DUF5677)